MPDTILFVPHAQRRPHDAAVLHRAAGHLRRATALIDRFLHQGVEGDFFAARDRAHQGLVMLCDEWDRGQQRDAQPVSP